MHKLLYVSSTRRDFPPPELEGILLKARVKNTTLGVTGLLLYVDGGFLQVLEGEQTIWRELYETIAGDNRHWDARVLLDKEAPRNFGDWSMGFRVLTEDTSEAGLVGITQSAIRGLINPGGAQPI